MKYLLIRLSLFVSLAATANSGFSAPKMEEQRPMGWVDLFYKKKALKVLGIFKEIKKKFRPQDPMMRYHSEKKTAEEILEIFNSLPENLRPQNPITWCYFEEKKAEEILKIFNGLPENLRPQDSMDWYYLGKKNAQEILRIFEGIPEKLHPQSSIGWCYLREKNAQEMADFLRKLPEHLRPKAVNSSVFLNSSLLSLNSDDKSWSPDHENSISVLAPLFFATRDLKKDDFETWLSLTQFDRDELLRMCIRGGCFEKTDLLMPEGLDDEGITTYLRNVLFPEGRWIGGDLGRTAGYLRDGRQTPIIRALRQLVEASLTLEGRLPQIKNQTVHDYEIKNCYENTFKKLKEKYPNPVFFDALMFEKKMKNLDNLKPDEHQDALSQFKRLQRENQQERLNVLWTAVTSLHDSDAVLSFIKGGFVGPWRMYWDMKSETEKNRETENAGSKKVIQAQIRQGNYTACLGGSRTMLVEALAGIHPDVPLNTSKSDIYNALLMQMSPFIQKMKVEGKNFSQFWELFKQENLVSESFVAMNQAFTQLQTDVTDELLEGYFEEVDRN